MLVLALDSSATASVALARVHGSEAGASFEILARYESEDTRSHAEVMGPYAQAALQDAGVRGEDLDAILTGTGPGPFTGLRVKVGKALDIASLVEDASPEAKHTRTELGVVTDAMLDAITAELEKIRGEKAPEGRWNPRTKRREAPGTPSGPVGGALGEPDEK